MECDQKKWERVEGASLSQTKINWTVGPIRQEMKARHCSPVRNLFRFVQRDNSLLKLYRTMTSRGAITNHYIITQEPATA